jgi:hypothetical protein
MTNPQLFRPAYLQLPDPERRALLEGIAASHPEFTLISFRTFQLYGLSTPSAIYTRRGVEFVFVPGDTVTLGWDSFSQPPSADAARPFLEEEGFRSLDRYVEYMKRRTSPVRQATIGPMLVERRPKPIGWIDLPADTPNFAEIVAQATQNCGLVTVSGNETTYYGRLKIIKIGNKTHYYTYAEMNYDEFVQKVQEEGFRLPTEDEFEYLCGGGSRTLYRWGDFLHGEVACQFDIPFESEPIDPSDEADRNPDDLAGANFFGVSICFDPYKSEVVMDSEVRSKGGDGGSALCGGGGDVEGFLPYVTFFRDWGIGMFREQVTGNYTVSRKILRL